MTTETQDRIIFNLANKFLRDKLLENKCNPEILNKYLFQNPLNSLSDYFQTLLESGASRERSQGVISKPIGGIINLKKILFNFNVKKVSKIKDSETLLNIIANSFDLKINKNKRGLWYQYCDTITSGAKFLNRFSDHTDFQNFVGLFHNDERARNALPLLIKQEVKGFGLALACDFLKESGFHWYAKPDVHLIEIFSKLGLSSSKSDYEVLNAVIRVAKNTNTTPYLVDKIFWLIGSGRFYKDINLHTGKVLLIGRNRDAYIRLVKTNLSEILINKNNKYARHNLY
jgi:hypothetical protein